MAELLIEKYRNQAIHMIEECTGENITEEEIEKLNGIIKDNFKDTEIKFTNTYNKTSKNFPLLTVIDNILAKEPIITGNGTLFNREDKGGKNITGSFVDMLLKTRKVYKNKMFKAQNDKDKALEEVMDMFQKVFKVLANA